MAEPYEVGVTTDDGTRFSKAIEAAAPAPGPDNEQILFFTIIGVYVGIIPFMIGLLWYPFIRSISRNRYNFFLSLTAGLLVFLGIDALVEGSEIAAGAVSPIFNGQMIIILVTTISFIALLYTSEKLTQKAIRKSMSSSFRAASTSSHYSDTVATNSSHTKSHSDQQQMQQLVKPLAISLMIAIGIGLHNFGEGLEIGAAQEKDSCTPLLRL